MNLSTRRRHKLLAGLEGLRRTHTIVEGDCYFTCPASGESCRDDSDTECICGADDHNARLDKLIADLRSP